MNTHNQTIQEDIEYVCTEEVLIDGTHYIPGDTISESAYAFLQPDDRENFENISTN